MTTSGTATKDESASDFGTFYASMRHAPVYVILGVQGSGTNLLTRILGATFNFAIIQDQALIYNAARRAGPAPSKAELQRLFEHLRARLFPSAFVRKTTRRIKANTTFDGIEQAFAETQVRTGADLAHFVYAYCAFKRGTTRMAIKSDDLWETIGDIDTVLPNRRIVLLTRDFRDNLLSITNKNFGPVEPLIAAAYVKERFRHYDAEFRRTSPEQRIHVRYEELLETPDAFAARFGQHFDLTEKGTPIGAVDTTRIRRNNVRKWAALSSRRLAMCEDVLREELETYQYDLASEPLRPRALDWYAARVRDWFKRVPQKLNVVRARLLK